MLHLYVHVPFCARRCSYCDFAIAVRREVPSAEFSGQVLREWARWRDDERFAAGTPLATIYFGGGTPSRLAPSAVERILAGIQRDRPLAPGAEVTLEANPDDVTGEAAAGWARAGVNRVSLGVQSFDARVLEWMHRTHGPGQVREAVDRLREAGITNLSIDLIYALPGELRRDWSADLAQGLELEPTHLSLYGLTVEPRTPLGRWVARGTAVPSADERYAAEFLQARERLTGAGFRHYEVSNYGRPGAEAVHNRAYWSQRDYLGLGPSAHSRAGGRRWWNLREWTAWSRAIEADLPAVAEAESLGPAELRTEEVYLGLRTDGGLEARQLPAHLIERWVSAGWAEQGEGRVVLTAEGWLRLDALVAQVP